MRDLRLKYSWETKKQFMELSDKEYRQRARLYRKCNRIIREAGR